MARIDIGRAARPSLALLMGAVLLFLSLALPASGQAPPPQPQRRPTAAQPSCPGLEIKLNQWNEVVAPVPLTHVAHFSDQICTFIGIAESGRLMRSTDGGSTWVNDGLLPGDAQVNAIISDQLTPSTAFIIADPVLDTEDPLAAASGLYVTRDAGATFTPVERFNHVAVNALVAAPSDPQVLYAAAEVGKALAETKITPLMKSTDFGQTWTPLPGTMALEPSAIAVESHNPEVVWVNSETFQGPAGLWLSTNGGVTFTPVHASPADDFDTTLILGGGSRLDAATPTGLLRTNDQGASFTTLQDGRVVSELTHEPLTQAALMAIIDGIPRRSVDDGTTFRTIATGLPDIRACSEVEMSADNELPAHFLLTVGGCSAAGNYIYRSDGVDLGISPLDPPESQFPFALRRPRIDMEILREVVVPEDADRTSGSVAFDGQILYYSNNYDSNVIHRMTTAGQYLGVIESPGLDIRSLAFDSSRRALWVTVALGGRPADIYRLDLTTEKWTFGFESPLNSDTNISFDPTIDRFRSYEHHGYRVYEIDYEGNIDRTCEVQGSGTDPNAALNPDRGHPEQLAPGFASGTATGNGNMYLQLEDDRTIYHVSRSCEILAVLEHRRFHESQTSAGFRLENDQLACDTITFTQPALWIRDATAGGTGANFVPDPSGEESRVVAYAVPYGYCPIQSQLELVDPAIKTQFNTVASFCALLSVAHRAEEAPIVGQNVSFSLDSRFIGTAATGFTGHACIEKRVLEKPSTEHNVRAAFFGSLSYLPSFAAGELSIRPPGPPPIVPPPLEPAPFVLVVPPPAPAPPNPAAPGQAPNPAPQQQPQPQQQAQAQAALASQEQEQPQLAFVHAQRIREEMAEEYALSGRRTKEPDLPREGQIVYLAAALMSVVYAGLHLARERVRTQKARW
ncbi:MAG: WD40/YVTN/BNR-like repeat-containing protein [Actinomycetota bacterium]